MHTQLLIDSVVRQTTVLIAQLATAGGIRAPLAHVAGQVFLDLARELEAQGVSRKVSADMFGVALRTYQRKTQRLRESATDRGRSLWEAVLGYLQEQAVVTRAAVLMRFRHDDQTLVRGVLRDLTESGFVFASGSGENTAYRAARTEELELLREADDPAALDALVWGIIYREGPITAARLLEGGSIAAEALTASLVRLLDAERIEARSLTEETGEVSYASRKLFIPLDAPTGWQSAVLDHFHALVRTICAKLELANASPEHEHTGGSTYSFTLWESHPLEAEVLDTLRRFRAEQTTLRARLDAHNAQSGVPTRHRMVVTYAGQYTYEEEDGQG